MLFLDKRCPPLNDDPLLPVAHAPALLQGFVDWRIQAPLDSIARAEGLRGDGGDSGRVSAAFIRRSIWCRRCWCRSKSMREGKASDPFLDCALEPAEDLTEAQRNFILKYFFQAHVERIIHRYPRYRELYERRERRYTVQDLRDLQIFSQIAWFDEDLLARDAELRALIAKGPGIFARGSGDDGAQAERGIEARAAGVSRVRGEGARSRFRRLRSIIRFCRCCAIPISPGPASAGSAAVAISVSRRCAGATGTGARVHRREVRREPEGAVAERRVGFGRCAGAGGGVRIHMVGYGQRSAGSHAGPRRRML